MKKLPVANLLLLVLLCFASGIAKVMLLPQELEFFEAAGFSPNLIVAYGTTQLVGGLLLIFDKTRIFAAVFMAANFTVSSILIVMEGKLAFGLFSLLPVAMAIVVILQSLKTRRHLLV